MSDMRIDYIREKTLSEKFWISNIGNDGSLKMLGSNGTTLNVTLTDSMPVINNSLKFEETIMKESKSKVKVGKLYSSNLI